MSLRIQENPATTGSKTVKVSAKQNRVKKKGLSISAVANYLVISKSMEKVKI